MTKMSDNISLPAAKPNVAGSHLSSSRLHLANHKNGISPLWADHKNARPVFLSIGRDHPASWHFSPHNITFYASRKMLVNVTEKHFCICVIQPACWVCISSFIGETYWLCLHHPAITRSASPRGFIQPKICETRWGLYCVNLFYWNGIFVMPPPIQPLPGQKEEEPSSKNICTLKRRCWMCRAVLSERHIRYASTQSLLVQLSPGFLFNPKSVRTQI